MDLVVLQNWLDNASFAVLFCTMLVYWAGVAFPGATVLQTLGTTGMAIANLGLAALLGARWLDAGYFPLSNLYESLLFIAWGVTAVHFLAESTSRSRLVGAFTSPVAMGITAFATLSLPAAMQKSEPLVPALKSNWLMMHVSVMLLSYACLMVGAVLAIAFLIVTRGQSIQLHGSSVGTGAYREGRYRLRRAGAPVEAEEPVASSGGSTAVLNPVAATTMALTPQRLSLADTLDNVSYRIIGLGFPLLTIGIIAGAVWANEAWGSYWSWDPKETWALITWLVFAAYLHARITRGWQGRRPALLAASGFLVVWICYLGVNLLGKGLHSYGWFF
ncbi:c-type cytochrome biogenesis protein CcsB [Leptolyngbya sp. FACHB-16]|uniref:c-type cytochrome biogenesis protein CcsB n=1 Tax=unclassified Leptolyngbya TaxID=2650499 RepID=UPI001689DBC0|nr:c-type cytochrome biogenesis protein CcsB [Leptolyngbya sp. FACHB-16]MBD2153780.1 c-type cytochrome biogenesis protein CcsB [Leptolyngbya sp. FACHB-16]